MSPPSHHSATPSRSHRVKGTATGAALRGTVIIILFLGGYIASYLPYRRQHIFEFHLDRSLYSSASTASTTARIFDFTPSPYAGAWDHFCFFFYLPCIKIDLFAELQRQQRDTR